MKVTIDKIEKGIASYIDNEILVHMEETGLQRLAIGIFAARIIQAKKAELVEMLKNPTVKSLGYTDAENNIDIDMIRNDIKTKMSEKGLVYENNFLGKLTFTKDDVDKLYNYIIK